MNPLIFLLIAVVVSVVGSLVIWLRNRKPTTWDSGISDFAREMQALQPRQHREPNRVVRPPAAWHEDDDHDHPLERQ